MARALELAPRRPWSAWDIQALLAMRAAGSTAGEIAWALDRSVPAIHTKAHELGATRPARRLRAV